MGWYDSCPHFSAMKTTFRTYSLPASVFVDLVRDAGDTGDTPRLRAVARQRKSPVDEAGKKDPEKLLFHPEKDYHGKLLEHSEERVVSRGVHMWPPADVPRKMEDLLCLRRGGRVQAMADGRSILYSVKDKGAQAGRLPILC